MREGEIVPIQEHATNEQRRLASLIFRDLTPEYRPRLAGMEIDVPAEECVILLQRPTFIFIMGELFDNCAEKEVDNVNVEVTTHLRYDPTREDFVLTVKDNVQYSPEGLQKQLANLAIISPGLIEKTVQLQKSGTLDEITEQIESDEPERLDKINTRDGEAGQCGILSVCTYLSKCQGSLQYLVEDGKIVAQATWNKKAYIDNTTLVKV
jgi:hypothetical protein